MPKIFTASLTGTQEIPTHASTASGAGTILWDAATNTLTYDFTIRGLDFGGVNFGPAIGVLPPTTATTADDVTAMHFHMGARGAAGPVAFGQLNPAQDVDDLIVRLNTDGSWTVHGVWETTDLSASMPITSFAAQLNQAPFGSDAPLYWEVYTNTFPGPTAVPGTTAFLGTPGGEIRGQLVAADTIIG